jgi:hypothetical protein
MPGKEYVLGDAVFQVYKRKEGGRVGPSRTP